MSTIDAAIIKKLTEADSETIVELSYETDTDGGLKFTVEDFKAVNSGDIRNCLFNSFKFKTIEGRFREYIIIGVNADEINLISIYNGYTNLQRLTRVESNGQGYYTSTLRYEIFDPVDYVETGYCVKKYSGTTELIIRALKELVKSTVDDSINN